MLQKISEDFLGSLRTIFNNNVDDTPEAVVVSITSADLDVNYRYDYATSTTSVAFAVTYYDENGYLRTLNDILQVVPSHIYINFNNAITGTHTLYITNLKAN